jgi:hypothetical protein
MRLISFDIDGTMTFGAPSGTITPEFVKQAQAIGYIVGSASDRTIANQQDMWKENGVELNFVSLKHRLHEVKEQFPADDYLHIGDTDMDRHFALQAGFRFADVRTIDPESNWIP